MGKAQALMEGVESEIGRKKEVSRKVRKGGLLKGGGQGGCLYFRAGL